MRRSGSERWADVPRGVGTGLTGYRDTVRTAPRETLSAETVEAMAAKLRRYRYERVYGAFNGRTIRVEGAQAVERSAERYIRHLGMR